MSDDKIDEAIGFAPNDVRDRARRLYYEAQQGQRVSNEHRANLYRDLLRCLDDVATEFRARGRGDSRFVQLRARLAALAAADVHMDSVRPPGFGMMRTTLFTELCEAVKADEAGEWCDLAAGIAGPNVTAFINRTTEVIATQQPITARPAVAQPAPVVDARLGGWIEDGDTIPAELIEVARDAICREFGNNGTDGYYKRILVKVFAALATQQPTTARQQFDALREALKAEARETFMGIKLVEDPSLPADTFRLHVRLAK